MWTFTYCCFIRVYYKEYLIGYKSVTTQYWCLYVSFAVSKSKRCVAGRPEENIHLATFWFEMVNGLFKSSGSSKHFSPTLNIWLLSYLLTLSVCCLVLHRLPTVFFLFFLELYHIKQFPTVDKIMLLDLSGGFRNVFKRNCNLSPWVIPLFYVIRYYKYISYTAIATMNSCPADRKCSLTCCVSHESEVLRGQV